MAFKWLGSIFVDHSNRGDYIPIAFFISLKSGKEWD